MEEDRHPLHGSVVRNSTQEPLRPEVCTDEEQKCSDIIGPQHIKVDLDDIKPSEPED